MRNGVYFLLYSIALLCLAVGCGGSEENKEVEVTAYDQSVDERMAERGKEAMSQAERRKAER